MSDPDQPATPATEPQGPPPPAGPAEMRIGRAAGGWLDIITPLRERVRVELFCPASMDWYEAELSPHRRPEGQPDPRTRCDSWEKYLAEFQQRLGPDFRRVLIEAGYPPVLDPKAHPRTKLEIVLCQATSPFSLILVYWYKEAAPVIIQFPESVVPREGCGICPGCDPEGIAQRNLLAQLEDADRKGQIPADSEMAAFLAGLREARWLTEAQETLASGDADRCARVRGELEAGEAAGAFTPESPRGLLLAQQREARWFAPAREALASGDPDRLAEAQAALSFALAQKLITDSGQARDLIEKLRAARTG